MYVHMYVYINEANVRTFCIIMVLIVGCFYCTVCDVFNLSIN